MPTPPDRSSWVCGLCGSTAEELASPLHPPLDGPVVIRRADGEFNSDRGDMDLSRWADLDARSAPGRRLGGSLTTHSRKARRTDEARPGHLRRMTHERLI
jgi:hypothetical protein